MSQSKKRGRDYYLNRNERHYCAICNVWMGSDRHSILSHENGQRHINRVEQQGFERMRKKTEQEKQDKALQATLLAMNAAAHSAVGRDLPQFRGTKPLSTVSSSSLMSHRVLPPTVKSQAPDAGNRDDWEARKKKKQKEQEVERKRKEKLRKGETEDPSVPQSSSSSIKKSRFVPMEHGHYRATAEDGSIRTCLEANVFWGMLEPEMQVELWCGPTLATEQERRLSSYHWKQALVTACKNQRVDVAYLASDDATEETLVTSVDLKRVRIVLDGSNEMLPDTVAEARLMAGIDDGEAKNIEVSNQVIDEATGLSGWSTVAIKQTTVRKELQEERARLREARRLKAMEEAKEKKRAQAMQMEEAAAANADDSALGAYDVWNRGEKDGYKGMKLSEESTQDQKTSAYETMTKKLSQGKDVQFKKKPAAFKAKKRKANMRKTTSED